MSTRVFLCLSAAALFGAGATWAAASNSHSIDVTFSSAMSVNGKVLPAGDYRFAWSGAAEKVDVTIERDHKVVETTTARLEARPDSASEEEVISRTPKTGPQALEEVCPRGKKTALVFSGS